MHCRQWSSSAVNLNNEWGKKAKKAKVINYQPLKILFPSRVYLPLSFGVVINFVTFLLIIFTLPFLGRRWTNPMNPCLQGYFRFFPAAKYFSVHILLDVVIICNPRNTVAFFLRVCDCDCVSVSVLERATNSFFCSARLFFHILLWIKHFKPTLDTRLTYELQMKYEALSFVYVDAIVHKMSSSVIIVKRFRFYRNLLLFFEFRYYPY